MKFGKFADLHLAGALSSIYLYANIPAQYLTHHPSLSYNPTIHPNIRIPPAHKTRGNLLILEIHQQEEGLATYTRPSDTLGGYVLRCLIYPSIVLASSTRRPWISSAFAQLSNSSRRSAITSSVATLSIILPSLELSYHPTYPAFSSLDLLSFHILPYKMNSCCYFRRLSSICRTFCWCSLGPPARLLCLCPLTSLGLLELVGPSVATC